jgi:hypothetical protein
MMDASRDLLMFTPRFHLIALLIFSCGASHVQAQGWAEKMLKEGVTHDFGTIPRGAQLLHRFPITNIYAVRMEITAVQSGCGCVTASAAKRVLEPKESTTIDVHMDASRFQGPKSVGVRVSVGPEFVSSAELRVSAQSRADLVFNPGQIQFGVVNAGSGATQTVDVEYAGAQELTISEVLVNNLPIEAKLSELYRKPGRIGYQVKATLKSSAPAGLIKDLIYLKTSDPGMPMVGLLVEGTVQSSMSISPSSLSLGQVQAGDALTRRVVVRGQQPFTIQTVEGIGNGIELATPLGTAEALVHTLSFKIQIPESGAFKRELRVKTSAQDSPLTLGIDAQIGP